MQEGKTQEEDLSAALAAVLGAALVLTPNVLGMNKEGVGIER